MGFVTGMLGLSGPHMTALGTHDSSIPHLVMGFINLVAAVAASFLPETRGCALPETLKAAAEYGSDQRYFSYVRNVNFSTFSKDTDSKVSVAI